MITEKKAANALGGNTTRACDSCLVKRARWFCAADDAFLCRKCDSSVHSANQLASRHERVRLQSSSFKANESVSAAEQSPPAWHKGITRKARTPRHNKKPGSMAKSDQGKVSLNPPLPFVPEIGCEEANFMDDDDENEDLEQLLYRVPIYDPFAAELCKISSDDQVGNSAGANNLDDEVTEIRMGNHHEVGDENNNNGGGHDGHDDFDNLQGFLPSDMELAEFAADVENLLGGGLDEDSSEMTGVLGLLDDSKLEEEDGGHVDVCMNIHEINEDKRKSVKVEEELVEGMQFNPSMLDWNLDYDHHESSSPVAYSGEEEKVVFLMGAQSADDEVAFMENKQMMKRKISLRLNYEAVIAAWASQGGSPWTTGARPEINPDDGWLDCMSMWPSEIHQAHGCVGGRGDDRGREARVLRYREKRRNRLFSKKIRYEVRKLNAEKRPRMKGRFVKRTSSSNFVGSSSNSAAAAFPYLVNNK